MTITEETTTKLLEPSDVNAKIDQFGPRAWVEALKSSDYTHLEGRLGNFPAFTPAAGPLPIQACCLGVLAVACGVATDRRNDKVDRSIGVEWGIWDPIDEEYNSAGEDDTEFSEYIRPWWLNMSCPPDEELFEFHPVFERNRSVRSEMPHNMQTALMQINDYDGDQFGTGKTTDYSKQIEFIERWIIPAYDANAAAQLTTSDMSDTNTNGGAA